MKTIFLLFLTFLTVKANCQQLYINTFGSSSSKPVIFLHGGPGYNSANFEATTAQKLSEKGFFVIVYDRRGEGRSTDANAKFTFEETFADINNIYEKYGFTSASFIAHSFGGIAATLFAEKYPEKVNTLFLTSAPVSLQESFKNILARCSEIYTAKNDSVNLKFILTIQRMDTTSLMYSGSCFLQAMKNGFYSSKNSTEEAKQIYAAFKNDPLYKYAGSMDAAATMGFWKNENYTVLNLTNNIKALTAMNLNLVGLYGKDDGLYSAEQVSNLGEIIGSKNLFYFDDCSHNVYIDKQSEFLEVVSERVK